MSTELTKSQSTQLLKVDQRGYVRTPLAEREAILDEFERSGMTGIQFAKHYGIKYPTFSSWTRKRRQATASTAPVADNALSLAEVLTTPSQEPLRVELPGQATILIHDSGQLPLAVELLRNLAPA